MDLYSLRVVTFCCCFSFLMMAPLGVAGDVCLPTWNVFPERISTGGVQFHILSLEECIAHCEYDPQCVAIDFDTSAHPPCWVHTDPANLVGDSVYDYQGDSVTQFVINRTSCTLLPTGDCQLNWTRLEKTNSVNGQPYNFWTEYDCFTYCRYNLSCVAVDFDIGDGRSPACWIHTSYDDLSTDNTYDSFTAVQYRMNRACPPPTSANMDVGRCVGQPIKTGAWCPSGKVISIVSASYKVHPLCCNSPADKSDSPDSGKLTEYDVYVMGDAAFISELTSCEGRNSCSVVAKSFNHSTFIDNPFCPQQMYKTNFVSVKYACVAVGYTKPSTTKNPTTFLFPTESTSTQRPSVAPISPGVMCLRTWTRFANQKSVGGAVLDITDLQQCLMACLLRSDCLAIDFDNKSNPPCWIHTNANDLVGDNVYDSQDGVAQFVINRTCVTLPTGDCQLNWTRTSGLHSSNGEPHDFWTEYDCFTFCRYTPSCVAVDFDIAGSPACWIHTSYDDLTPDNTFDDSTTVVQYRMNRTCPAPPSAKYDIGRCVGQPLKNGSWCLPGEEIHIISAFYKIHPLCCNSPDDYSDAPDNPALAMYSIIYLSNTYIKEIEDCDAKTTCSVTSQSYQSDSITNTYCPNHMRKTNYVSLTYSCAKTGHSDPSTTPSLTSYQFPTEKTIPMEDGGAPNAERLSSQSSSRDALILAGIAIALAVLALLAVVIFVICWLRLEKLKQSETQSQVALNPVYADYPNHNSSSTISGVPSTNGRYAGSPFKDVKTVAYPDDDNPVAP